MAHTESKWYIWHPNNSQEVERRKLAPEQWPRRYELKKDAATVLTKRWLFGHRAQLELGMSGTANSNLRDFLSGLDVLPTIVIRTKEIKQK